MTAGTAADLYAFDQLSSDSSLLSIFAQFSGGSRLLGTGSGTSQAFSILVTNGFTVPDNGPTALLLGFNAGALFIGQRIFRLREREGFARA